MSQSTTPADSAPTPSPQGREGDGEFLNFNDFIQRQLGKTQGQVKSIELFSELLVLLVGSGLYLLTVVLFDHWIVTGGLGTATRLFACGVLVAGVGIFAWLNILPLLLRDINPIYAADAIERSQPSLKNSLINFLMLRGNNAPLPKMLYDAIEERAATDLSNVPVEGVVDRSRMLKIFYVLMALVAFGCVYKLASPKDPIRSMGRVIFPWTDLAAPTRVTIEDVKPGNAQAFLGSSVTVKALVLGLKGEETATLYYSTEDGSVVNQPVPLAPRESMQHEARLPPDGDGGSAGLGQSIRYYLTAGDFRTPDFRIEVVPPPTIVVESVEYEFPAYTGMPRRVMKNQGDLKALEGTRVVVHAVSNQTIQSGTALLDLDSDGQPPTLPLRAEGDDAKHVWGAFELKFAPDGTPQHESYLLRYRNSDGMLNPTPIRHRIEVLPDLAPTVEFSAPAKDVELPVNQTLELAIRAADQDFALKQVMLRMQLRERELFPATIPGSEPGLPLISSGTPARLQTSYVLNPAKLGLSSGDDLVYWAIATDTKTPGNTPVASQRWHVKIVSPVKAGPNELARNEPPANDPKNQDPKNQPQNGNPDGKGGKGEKPSDPRNPEGNPPQNSPNGEGEKDPKGQGNPTETKTFEPDKNGSDRLNDPKGNEKQEQVNPDQDPGRAFEKIEEHRRKEKEEETPKKDPESKKNEDQGGEEKGSKKNEEGEGKKKPDDKKNDKQEGGGDKKGEESGGDKQGDKKGEQSGEGKQESGKQESGKQGSGKQESKQGNESKQGGGDKQGNKQGKESKQGSGKQESKQGEGAQKSGNEKSGEKKGSPSEQGSGEKQGTGEKGEKKGEKQGNPGKQSGDDGKSDPEKGDKKGEGTDTQEKKQPGDLENEGSKAADKKSEGGAGKKSDKQGTETEEGPRPGDPNDKGGATQKGEGETKQGLPKKEGGDPKSPGEESKEEGGDRDKPSGGSDKKGQKQDGGPTPASQGKQDAKDKTGKPDQDSKGANEKGDEAKSPGISDKNSNSKAGEGGDRKGNGEKGGGQNSNQAGQGGAGSNTEADTGGKAGKEAGDGDKINRAGDKGPSEEKTGRSGSEAGKGSKTAPKKEGEGSGKNPENTGEKGTAGKQGEEASSSESDPSGEGGKAGSGRPQGKTDKGEAGVGQGNPTQGGTRDGDRPSGATDPKLNDPVNLSDAVEGVDLALRHLKDELEKPNPDQKLLDSLGGSREKAEQFYTRWKKMRDDAMRGGAENTDARKRFEESLRGLGISGGTANSDSRGTKTDELRNRGTTVVPPPPAFRDRTSGFRTGISKPTAENK